jgi:hypothetical protein
MWMWMIGGGGGVFRGGCRRGEGVLFCEKENREEVCDNDVGNGWLNKTMIG